MEPTAHTTSGTPIPRRRRALAGAAIAAWLAAIATAMAALADYMHTPAPQAAPADAWPDTLEPLDAGVHTLVLAVHPRCPCTVATVRQLEKLRDTPEHPLRIRAYAFEPARPDQPRDWRDTDVTRILERHGARVIPDPEGNAATTLRLTTSGHAVLFDPNANAVFQGGLTHARGVAGPSAAVVNINRVLAGQPHPLNTTHVYGCPIHNPQHTCQHPHTEAHHRCAPPNQEHTP